MTKAGVGMEAALGRELRQFVGRGVLGGLVDEGLGRGLVDELGESRLECGGRLGDGGFAHDAILDGLIGCPDARTPPEERVRRRIVPPLGEGETLGARSARGLI